MELLDKKGEGVKIVGFDKGGYGIDYFGKFEFYRLFVWLGVWGGVWFLFGGNGKLGYVGLFYLWYVGWMYGRVYEFGLLGDLCFYIGYI